VAVTDCLNFGNPERPDVYFQMQSVVHGIAEACRALATPVISGNVSLYNETGERSVYPTPVIGMLGILEDVTRHCRPAFKVAFDEVFLLGAPIEQPVEALGGSEYLKTERGIIGGRLALDLQLEARVQRATLGAIRQGIVSTAHDCSDGGLAVALAEMCLASTSGVKGRGLGLDAANTVLGRRLDAALFGETQSRIIVTVGPLDRARLLEIAGGLGVPAYLIGRVSAEPRFRLGPIDLPLDTLRDAYEHGLERALTAGG
jgi:phosphoribosylformylglycinamidine synthase